jgi:hypothetical protein
MSTTNSLAFFPGVAAEAFRDALTAYFAAEGRPVVEWGARAVASPIPAVRASPELRAVAWTQLTLSGADHAVIVADETLGPWGRWSPRMVRAISGATGGFAAAAEITRGSDQYGFGLFYAGRTVEIVQCDGDGKVWQFGTTNETARALCGETAVYDRYQATFVALTGENTPALLRSAAAMRSYCIVVAPPDPPNSGLVVDNESGPMSRVVLAGVEESDFRHVLADPALSHAHGQGWRWISCNAPFTGLPYVMLQRNWSLDETLVTALAIRLGFGLGISVEGKGRPFRWMRVEPDGITHSGRSCGADAFIEQCAAFSITMGEPPDMLCWNSQHPGQLLP